MIKIFYEKIYNITLALFAYQGGSAHHALHSRRIVFLRLLYAGAAFILSAWLTPAAPNLAVPQSFATDP